MTPASQVLLAAVTIGVGVPACWFLGTWAGLELRARVIDRHLADCTKTSAECGSRYHQEDFLR